MRQRVRSPRVSNPDLSGLPYGRASDTFHSPRVVRLTVLVICITLFAPTIHISAQRRATATITIDTSRPTNRIVPSHALGAGVDGHAKGVNDLQLMPANIREMLSAGFKSLTYRLRTEL